VGGRGASSPGRAPHRSRGERSARATPCSDPTHPRRRSVGAPVLLAAARVPVRSYGRRAVNAKRRCACRAPGCAKRGPNLLVGTWTSGSPLTRPSPGRRIFELANVPGRGKFHCDERQHDSLAVWVRPSLAGVCGVGVSDPEPVAHRLSRADRGCVSVGLTPAMSARRPRPDRSGLVATQSNAARCVVVGNSTVVVVGNLNSLSGTSNRCRKPHRYREPQSLSGTSIVVGNPPPTPSASNLSAGRLGGQMSFVTNLCQSIHRGARDSACQAAGADPVAWVDDVGPRVSFRDS